MTRLPLPRCSLRKFCLLLLWVSSSSLLSLLASPLPYSSTRSPRDLYQWPTSKIPSWLYTCSSTTMQPHSYPLFLLQSLVILTSVASSTSSNASDAAALLAFKAKADLSNALPYSSKTTLHFCQWAGIQCAKSKVIRMVIQGLDLGGVFAPDTLTRLDQLRVLSLQNNSLTGPIPDLSGFINLKTLFLDHNSFSASLPHSLSSLHRLRTLDLSRREWLLWWPRLTRASVFEDLETAGFSLEYG